MITSHQKKNSARILSKRDFSSRLKKMLGTRPGNLSLYETAFVHRSASILKNGSERINNERLEFLGDAVLDTILSDYIFEKFPDANEGFMTKLRSKIVNREILNQLAVSVGINDLLKCNVGPGNSVRNLYGDALEALIGAMFLDKGFKKTRKIFIKNVLNKHLRINDIVNTDNDHKSLVFEWAQKHKHNLTFTYKEEYDFNTRKSVFTSILLIDNKEFGQGLGSSKKEAEQEASAKAWEKLRILPDS